MRGKYKVMFIFCCVRSTNKTKALLPIYILINRFEFTCMYMEAMATMSESADKSTAFTPKWPILNPRRKKVLEDTGPSHHADAITVIVITTPVVPASVSRLLPHAVNWCAVTCMMPHVASAAQP